MASIFLLTFLVSTDSFILTDILVTGLIIYQVYGLVQFLDKTNKEIVAFLNSIKYDDFTHTYNTRNEGSSIDMVYKEFNNVIKKFREIRAEKEAQYHYLKTIVQHVGIGIITFEKNVEIQIINAAAKNQLNIDEVKHINQLKATSPLLVETIKLLKTGGRDLVKIERGGDVVQLAVYAIELSLRDKEFKLISMQNIQSELEENEMDAWQNLIRVLTHEIMNSVTPISSLAATVESELESQLKNGSLDQMKLEDVEDMHLAVKTIHNRSVGLIKFVSDFRNLTRIPMPKLEPMMVGKLFDHILILLKFDMEKEHIRITCDFEDNLHIRVDKEQIEQVLINIIKNAIQALAENEELQKAKSIIIKAGYHEKAGIFISITDNGPGIDPEALKKIFIPFFTTKKGGSGIGLSLSKQIMRKHNGNITVNSKVNEGTEFVLRFPVMEIQPV
ncbi:MAG: ATP-binding protein [Bacteroidetes bacterium]|nr:ATP-binding protein [Bacteroidota bacterium]MDA1119055.1 ATP-binding protein [Bacteroidota bacterium]